MASYDLRTNGPTTLGGGDTCEALASQLFAVSQAADALIVAYIAGTDLIDVDAEVEALQEVLMLHTDALYEPNV